MFVQLGNDIKAELLTAPLSWIEAHGAKYAEIPHVGGKPSIQFTAEDLVGLEWQFKLSREFCDPGDALSKLHIAKSTGEVLPIILGNGVFVGRFVIRTLDVGVKQTTAQGDLITVTIGVSFLEYIPPPGSDAQRNDGAGIRGNGAMPQRPARPVTTEPQSMMSDISNARNLINQIKAGYAAVRKGTKALKRGIRDAKKLAASVKNFYQSALTKINKFNKLKKRLTKLPTSLEDAIAYANALEQLDNLANVSEFGLLTNGMEKAADNVMGDSSGGAAFCGTKEIGN